ncbi:MAG TPA: hypothetical protein VFE24_11200, partial [Pirellulales bacterium]|nr:hypothetical protein [Pirellulales bacterium]
MMRPKFEPLRLTCLALCAILGWSAAARADLLVSDDFGSQVVRYDAATGAFLSTLIPFDPNGPLQGAIGMRLDANGDLLVTSQYANSILRYDLFSGAFLGTFASNDTTPNTHLSNPADLVWGPDHNLYVANFAGSSVDRFAADGTSQGPYTITAGSGVTINGTASAIFGPD